MNHNITEEEILFSAVSREELAAYDSKAAFAAFTDRVKRSGRKRRARIIGISSFAAAALLFAVSALSFRAGRTDIESRLADITVEAPSGSRTKTTLPDGSVVWLNAGSTLRYSQSFGVADRQVALDGEGYFEVARKEDLPFRVCTDNVHVRVLGTKFNVRDYPDDPEAVVSLDEGRIAMCSPMSPADEKLLSPQHKAAVDKRSGRIVIESCETSGHQQWINGRLVFDGEPLPLIIKDIERCYSVQITLNDEKLSTLRFYGDFLRQEQSLTEVMDALATAGKFQYRLSGRQIEIY